MNEKQLDDLMAKNRAAITEKNKAYWAAYRNANAAKIEARNAAYDAVVAANAEKVLAYNAAYNTVNAEKILAYHATNTKKFKVCQASYCTAVSAS